MFTKKLFQIAFLLSRKFRLGWLFQVPETVKHTATHPVTSSLWYTATE